jgi:ribosomal protein S27AE
VSDCEQEMCPNWDGWGCPCDVLDIAKPGRLDCPECGSPAVHDAWDGWSCGLCGWMENPL